MTPDFKMPSYQELDAIHRRASALRAEVFRYGLRAVGRAITQLPRAVGDFIYNTART